MRERERKKQQPSERERKREKQPTVKRRGEKPTE